MLPRPHHSLTQWQTVVLQTLRSIPRGSVATYQAVARRAGRPRACRAVGNILHRNPDPKQFPCHRVVQRSGCVGGYAFGVKAKIIKLKREGVRFSSARRIHQQCILYA